MMGVSLRDSCPFELRKGPSRRPGGGGLLLAFLLLLLPAALRAETIAITGAKAYTMADAAPINNATIIMRDGRIVAVGAGLAAPAGARIVAAGGRVVTPGLMSAATQLGLVEIAAADDSSDQSVSTGPLGAAFDVQYALDPNSQPVQQARADGVARAMAFPDVAAGAPFAGNGALVHLVEGPEILERPKAAMFAAVGAATSPRVGGSRSAAWLLLRNALTEARAYRAARGPRDQLLNRLDVEALLPVLDRRMPLVIGAQRESDIRQAVKLGQEFGIRVVILGGAEAWRAASLLASTQTPVILDPMAGLPMSYDEIGARPDNAALLQKAGVLVALSVPGAGIHLSYNVGTALREAAGTEAANGMAYVDALKTITVNAARIWGLADRYGTIEPGRDADLVIWDGDPLEPTSAPQAVFVGGRAVSLVTRQSALRDRYHPKHADNGLPPSYRLGAPR